MSDKFYAVFANFFSYIGVFINMSIIKIVEKGKYDYKLLKKIYIMWKYWGKSLLKILSKTVDNDKNEFWVRKYIII